MLRGFVAGSLVLIVIYVATQQGASTKTETASRWSVEVLRRLTSPDVAGIGDHSKPSSDARINDPGKRTSGSRNIPV